MGVPTLTLACSVSTVGGLIYGYELGIISGALLQLKEDFHLSALQQEGVVSSLLIGALLGSVVGGCVIDGYGRRNSILLSNILVLGGTVLLLLGSFPTLVMGRVTVGLAVCISSMSCCIFVSELVTPEHRGFLVSLYEAGITVGVLAAYAINYILSGYPHGWKWMFGFVFAPTLIQLALIWCLSSNPKRESDDNDRNSNIKGISRPCFSSFYLFEDNMRTRTVLALGLVLFQQFTGQPNVLLYASTIFCSAGFQSGSSAALASIGLGCVKVVATGVSMVFSDRVGRRPLLISSCFIMALSLVIIGLLSGHLSEDVSVNATLPAELLHDPQPPREHTLVNWVLLLCLMAVVSAYAVGFGPMTWLLLSEIFPADVRGRAFAFTSCFNWAANLVVSFTFLNAIEMIGLSGVFLVYGTVAVAAGLFFFFLLPETKGRTLEDIDRDLSRFHHQQKCWSFSSSVDSPLHYQRVDCQVSII
ncbi:solute carrier family 2, facilitated glucose transporter member 10 [Gouania willdenowi]|uniref:Solute carrier family 2, facilitated glucose transporter member 10 n=1 Tax=Gouania willdenowi TaxID=441366 RepID=A0A8C5DES5_GOUWI|nr:solute carrier family 2, facilitated glucose transporter member 10 [Gouania willdenowi]XP_028303105.1 solute carrier family 2, facilitated glucose transporter member 10 [Gouania willdenowi]